MLFPSVFVSVTFLLLDLTVPGASLELRNGAYEDLVVSISDSVPTTDCQAILSNLETTLTSASGYLFSALDGRAYLHGTSVVLPETWPDSCLPRGQRPVPHTGDNADLTILSTGDDPRGKLWTQQSAGCGQPGDGMFLGWEGLVKRDDTLARSLVKEFAMYRYGVFEEQGYMNDPIHPMCYYDDQNKKAVITGCSDEPINDLGICDFSSSTSLATYNTSRMVSPQARSSILFAAEAPNVSMFCDKFTHDKHAPTKHNLLCGRQSTLDVIMLHEDFKGTKGGQGGELEQGGSSEIRNTQVRVKYVRQTVTRYVLVIENTSDMLRRESWQFLRVAIRKWVYDLPANAEVGLVMTNDTGSLKLLKLRSMTNSNNRDSVASAIPYTPSDSSMQPCLHCAMREAFDMLAEKAKVEGAGTGVIVIIATGMNYNSNVQSIMKDCKKAKVKIATINYPVIVRSDILDMLATETDGVSFTVLERKANVQSTLFSTYFQLTNVLYNIIEKFYAGNKNDLPMEIHRREIKDDGRSSITGSFVLDENMGEPAKFVLYTYNIYAPLIKSVKLISPSLKEYTTRSDNMLMFQMIRLNTNLTEMGTWTYTVEPFIGNPQPHFLQVMASPISPTVPIIKARFWTHQNEPRAPIILFAEVKYGDYPILGAKVDVIIRKAESNGSVVFSERLELLDSGSGDPDITKADGVYSRYFSAMNGGAGVYTFEVTVSDNGNTAYTWVKDGNTEEDVTPCCGSKVPSRNVAPISPFQRVLPIKTISFTPDDINKANEFSVGRVGDLRVEIIPEDKKARLSWTAPDMGGHNVARYEIKYAYTIDDITDNFQLNAIEWSLGRPFPLAAGSETTFTLDMSQDPSLLDKPLYFAIKSYTNTQTDSTQSTSNIVRVFVPRPLPPPTVIPPYSVNNHDSSNWPYLTSNVNSGDISSGPAVAKSANIGLELILPIVIGAIVLMVILILYCYCCVVKRRGLDRGNLKGVNNGGDKHNMQSTITIVPSSPGYGQQHVAVGTPEMHTIGVPTLPTPTHNQQQHIPAHYTTYTNPQSPSIIDSDSSDKKRYSLIHPLESQLIDDLKAHHQQQQQYNVSIIGNQQQQTTLPRPNPSLQQQTLSPYNSWSASQLLHEHERRHSPNMTMEEVMAMEDQWKSGGGQQIVMIDATGHQLILPDQYNTQTQMNPQHIPPPVPPLPLLAPSYQPTTNYNQSNNGYAIYGTNPNQSQINNQSIYQTMHRTNDQTNSGGMSAAPPNVNYNAQGSLQGSLTSVNSGEKKRRNVTMV